MKGEEAEVPGDDLLDYGVAVLDSAPARREPQVLVERLVRVIGVVEQRVGRLKVIIIIIIIITIIIIIVIIVITSIIIIIIIIIISYSRVSSDL